MDSCTQADPGILTSDVADPEIASCSGPQKRNLRLLRSGQSNEDLWRGAPITIRRCGSQLLSGSVEGLGMVTKLIQNPVALMAKPDSCTLEMHDAYLQVQRMARYDACSKAERLDRHLLGAMRSLCPRKSDGSAAIGSVELKRQKDSCEKRASGCLERWASEQKDRLAWFHETYLALIRDAGGPGSQVLTEPPFEFGWRTGKEALLGEKKTVEEAAAIRRALWEAKKTASSPVPSVQPCVKRPSPSSSDADDEDLDNGDLSPDEYENDPEDRLLVGWEKKIAAVDRKWFLAGRNEFLTNDELRTYVQTMGWADSSNSGREDWLRIIVANLDAALSGAPKIKRDRPVKVPVNPPS